MFNPFFDATVLSDKELQNKIEEVSLRVTKARLAGIQYEIIENMRSVIISCEDELQSRYAKKTLEEVQKDSPVIFESDKDYAKEEKNNENFKKSINRPEW